MGVLSSCWGRSGVRAALRNGPLRGGVGEGVGRLSPGGSHRWQYRLSIGAREKGLSLSCAMRFGLSPRADVGVTAAVAWS